MRRHEKEIIDFAIIKDIILNIDVCRLGFAVAGVPYIVPMNFGITFSTPQSEPTELYFHCAKNGRKLDMMDENSRVCFEMDSGHKLVKAENVCNWGMNYSSIVGYGDLSVVENEGSRKVALSLIMKHYNGGVDVDHNYSKKDLSRTTVLKLSIKSLSCKTSS